MGKLTPKDKKQRDMLQLLRQGTPQANAMKLVGVSQSTWYSWRKENDFDAVVENAIAEGKELKADLGARAEHSTGREALDVFLNLYATTGQFEDSCTGSGLNIQDVLAYVNPLASNYNPQFHRLFEDSKKLIALRAEDALAENVRKKGKGYTTDARWLLERLRPDEYGLKKQAEEKPPEKGISPEQAAQIIKNLLGNDATSEPIN